MNKTARKGILLAGGANTRLYPMTFAVPKSLLPVYDKPMIYYPLTTLLMAGVKDILVITSPGGLEAHRLALGNGADFGVRLTYAVQKKPRGIADALIIARDFVAGHPSVLLLSDNILYGGNLSRRLSLPPASGAAIFASAVADPRAFGVVEIDTDGSVLSLAEKPKKPKSNYAVTGCYFYDSQAPKMAAKLRPSARGELEITDINGEYLKHKALSVHVFKNTAWFDAGTPDGLMQAAKAVCARQKRSGRLVGCPEEIARQNGWLSAAKLRQRAAKMKNTEYGEYLMTLL